MSLRRLHIHLKVSLGKPRSLQSQLELLLQLNIYEKPFAPEIKAPVPPPAAESNAFGPIVEIAIYYSSSAGRGVLPSSNHFRYSW